MEINAITLENGKEYLIIDILEKDNNRYLFLANENDDKDKCVRKVITENGKEYLTKLDTNDEFEEVMSLFSAKYKGE